MLRTIARPLCRIQRLSSFAPCSLAPCSLAPCIAAFALAAILSGCGQETVVQGLNEREANQILEVLADAKVQANKQVFDDGRKVTFSVVVAAGKQMDAIRTLNLNELPRRRDRGYQQVFDKSGLIPTSTEEKSRQLSALEGEIEKQLKLIEGILDVQVNLVVPSDSALKTAEDQQTPTTASVTVKYMPGVGGTKPLSEPQIQAIVAAGVEKLTSDRVIVVMSPTRKSVANANSASRVSAPRRGLGRFSDRTLRMLAVAVSVMVILMGAGMFYLASSLRAVRGRFARLQGEIAKARRKPSDESMV